MNKKDMRAHFNKICRKRDGDKCFFCDETENLDVHHIMDRHYFPNGGYVRQNGITLCNQHHEDAELYHESNCLKWVVGMSPDDLYKLIGSSLEEAIKADENNV